MSSRAIAPLTAVRAAFTEIVDYAGLFPPARLELDSAIRAYAQYRGEPESWMLSRFVCPTQRLADFTPAHETLFDDAPGFRFSGLGRGGATSADFLAGLKEDAVAMRTFNQRHAGRAQVDAFEARLPDDVSASGDVRKLLDTAADILSESVAADELPIFVEVSLAGDWRERLAGVIDGLVEHNAAQADRRVGLKLRCGGLEASAFPGNEQVAGVIAICRDGETPLKFTAGLHHPLRTADRAIGVTMHGFVNVFAAGILACVRDVDEETLGLVIAEERPGAFRFGTSGLSWDGFTVTAEEIEQARIGAVISFGSCSFDEPRNDLRALGWI